MAPCVSPPARSAITHGFITGYARRRIARRFAVDFRSRLKVDDHRQRPLARAAEAGFHRCDASVFNVPSRLRLPLAHKKIVTIYDLVEPPTLEAHALIDGVALTN